MLAASQPFRRRTVTAVGISISPISKMAFSRLRFSVLAVVVAGTPVHAQARGQMLDTAAACATALQALGAGSVQSRPPFALRRCGTSAADAVARAFRGAAQNADTVVWAELYALSVQVLDGRMIDAAEAIARDQTASTPARVVAMSALVTAYRPGAFILLRWRSLLESNFAPGQQCVQVMTPGPEVFGVLPTGLGPRIAKAFDMIAAEEATPSVVRALAKCARRTITDYYTPPSQLAAAYVCDNRFAVTTSAQPTDGVRMRVGGESGLRLLAQLTSAPMVIRLSRVQDLQLFINDQLVASTHHGRVSCVANAYRKAGRAIPASVDTLAGWAR